AKLYQMSDTYYVMEEIGVMNGTYVNGNRLTTGVPIAVQNGDVLKFGLVSMTFHPPASSPADPLPTSPVRDPAPARPRVPDSRNRRRPGRAAGGGRVPDGRRFPPLAAVSVRGPPALRDRRRPRVGEGGDRAGPLPGSALGPDAPRTAPRRGRRGRRDRLGPRGLAQPVSVLRQGPRRLESGPLRLSGGVGPRRNADRE